VIERPVCAHLGMQFHCEMTPALVVEWAQGESGGAEVAEERRRTGGPGVQSPEAMCEAAAARAGRMNRLAARLYARWRRGLRTG
jgi:hypothetical protein